MNNFGRHCTRLTIILCALYIEQNPIVRKRDDFHTPTVTLKSKQIVGGLSEKNLFTDTVFTC